MAYVITDLCREVKDAGCVDICPADCIHPRPDEAEFPKVDQLYIDPDECIDCRLCAEVCPAAAIQHADDLAPGKFGFIELNRDWYAGRKPPT